VIIHAVLPNPTCEVYLLLPNDNRKMTAAPESGLSPLLLPDLASHKVDIVFVHGLNGHRSRTWTNQASELWPLWLRDDLEGVRAWTYGYDASVTIGSRDSIKLHSIRFLDLMVGSMVGKSASTQFYYYYTLLS
jgi:hypothetical protein